MGDRLTLTRALESSGMASAVAERIATEIYDAIHENVATKADLREVETALKTDLRGLERRLELRFGQIDTRFARIETGLLRARRRRPSLQRWGIGRPRRCRRSAPGASIVVPARPTRCASASA